MNTRRYRDVVHDNNNNYYTPTCSLLRNDTPNRIVATACAVRMVRLYQTRISRRVPVDPPLPITTPEHEEPNRTDGKKKLVCEK